MSRWEIVSIAAMSVGLVLVLFFVPSRSRAQCSPSMILSGESTNMPVSGNFGGLVSGYGDIDDDGFDDFVIKSKGLNEAGVINRFVKIYSGRTGDVLRVYSGEFSADDAFGSSFANVGDVDNDGYPDLIIGALTNDVGGQNAGRAFVYSGKTGDLLHVFTGDRAYANLGAFVAGAGDVDNDGHPDLLVVETPRDALTPVLLRVYSGRTGDQLFTLPGVATMSSAGDVNGDGFADILLGFSGGVVGGIATGKALVYSGKTREILHTFVGEFGGNKFGESVLGFGDIDGDEVDDLAVAAPSHGAGGRVYVYSGQTGTLLYTIDGEPEGAKSGGDRFGRTMSGAGDIDGDGVTDLIIGAPWSDVGGVNAGRAYIYSGASGALLFKLNSEYATDEFGISVSGVGDLDGDGAPDVIVGSSNHRNEDGGLGRVYIYSTSGFTDVGCDCCSVPGDIYQDGIFNIRDVTLGILSLFSHIAYVPPCLDEADSNGDGFFNVADVTYGIARIFGGGAAPVCGSNGF